MGPIKAVVFDWDGTLVNTMGLKIANAAALFHEEFGVDPARVEVSYKQYSGVPRRELFDYIANETVGRGLSELEYNHLSERFTKRNVEASKRSEILSSETRPLLESIREGGYLLFVSSAAAPDEIRQLADHVGITPYFSEILGSFGAFRKGKPHFSHILEKYGLKSSELLFIGDEKADMRLAGRLGIACVGIKREASAEELMGEFADHVIRKLSDLGGILSHV